MSCVGLIPFPAQASDQSRRADRSSASTIVRQRVEGSKWRLLAQLIVQHERMLSAVPDSRRALAAQILKFSSAGAGNDEVGLLRHTILEDARALEHEAARSPG